MFYNWKKVLLNPFQLLRFGIAGFVNAGISIAVFYICLWFNMPYWLAAATSLGSGIVNNFYVYRRFVFIQKSSSYFCRYAAIQLAIYFSNIILQVLLSRIGISTGWCYLLLLGPSMLAGYILTRLFAFPPSHGAL